MKVSAIAKGHDGMAVRVPGDVFEMPDGSRAPWFVPVVDGDEFTESDIVAEVQKIFDTRAAAQLAADRVAAIANLDVRRSVSAGVNTAIANAAAQKLAADNAVNDAKTQSDSANTPAEHEAAAAAVAKANAGLAAAESAVSAAHESKTVFMKDNYPAQPQNKGHKSFNDPVTDKVYVQPGD